MKARVYDSRMADGNRDPHFDVRGCLTPAGIAAIQRAPAGRVPAELASHVGACVRCQERLLATESLRAPGAPPAQRPQPWRTLLAVALLVISAFFLLMMARWLSGR
jgi:hypothetical protein